MSRILPIRAHDRKHPSPASARGGRLPLPVSVPHGGYSIPLDILHHIDLEFKDIFPDSDPCTRTIYSFADEVFSFHESDIARAVVDLNRADDDLPPWNIDGVVKSHTVMGKEIYLPGSAPDRRGIEILLERYYYPYHQNIASALADPGLLCALDCHSMLEFPPETSAGETKTRPFICLSNCGDENGDGNSDELSCPPDLLNLLANCLRSVFPEEADSIVLNAPFKGGYISRYHRGTVPWIQIELNRRAYLREPWFEPASLRVDNAILHTLRKKFLQALTVFCQEALARQSLENMESSRSFFFPATPSLS